MPPRRSAADNAFTVPPTAVTMAASCREPCLQDSGAHSRRQERKTSDQERKQQLTGSDSHTHAPCLGNRAPSTERMRHPHPTSDFRIGFTCSRRITPTL
jgi:hypothetical protein